MRQGIILPQSNQEQNTNDLFFKTKWGKVQGSWAWTDLAVTYILILTVSLTLFRKLRRKVNTFLMIQCKNSWFVMVSVNHDFLQTLVALGVQGAGVLWSLD